MKFSEKILFVKKQIDLYYNMITDIEFMKTLSGSVIRSVVKNHYVFREIFNDPDQKSNLIAFLNKVYGKETVQLIINNLNL